MLKRVCVFLDKHSPPVRDREIERGRFTITDHIIQSFFLSLLSNHHFLVMTFFFRSPISAFMGISVSVFVSMSTVDVWLGASMWRKNKNMNKLLCINAC